MESTYLGLKQRPTRFIDRIRAQIGNSRHLWMWDEFSIHNELSGIGFIDIRRCKFNDCTEPIFLEVEEPTRFVDDENNIVELAIECRRPQ